MIIQMKVVTDFLKDLFTHIFMCVCVCVWVLSTS